MKTILIVSAQFAPETNAAAKRMTAMSQYLHEQGWDVAVVTLLPHYPQNKIYEGFEQPTPSTTFREGVKVVRYRPWIVSRGNMASRLLSETVFCIHVFFAVLRSRAHLIYATTPYMFTAPFALLASKLTNKRLVTEVRDLTWQYAKATGKKTYGLDKVLEGLMRLTARFSDLVVTTTEGQAAYFQTGHTRCIPNGVKQDLMDAFRSIRQSQNVMTPQPKIVYAGLLGYPQGLETLVEAAAKLPTAEFVFAGTGVERNKLEGLSQSLGLDNVSFTGYLSFPDLMQLYKEADILVAQLRKSPEFKVVQPSKLWEYMATAKPVVYAGEGEIVDILNTHKIALTVPPENPEALAEAIGKLIANPEEARALGLRGFDFVKEQRNREALLEKLEKHLEEILKT